MTRDELCDAYLKFFEEKRHTILPSSSLLPGNDPTLLLTTAGMVQIKPFFMGEEIPPSPRLTSCQKCFRTTDIESVGDAQHLTFFEMLGNFSIGDYFKKEAIAWGWEFVTERLRIPPEKLWITIYRDDDEAFEYWRQLGVPAAKIVRLGEKDNFWGPAGNTGPCGPCSEIHFDFGNETGCGKDDCKPGCDCGRFCEIWNLVFTQFNQDENGNRAPLPRPNIDTGMGVERVVTVLSAKDSVYETDIFRPQMDIIKELCGISYGQGEDTDLALRVVAEHGRGITFLISDGVIPSNEGAGYVLRRLLRRSLLFARKLGLEKPFLGNIAETTIKQMAHIYPDIEIRRKFILEVINGEEERFRQTLNTGLELLEDIMQGSAGKEISGHEAFTLYDTYGFPIEITREIAAERGFTVDSEGFNASMKEQRERARAAHKFVNTQSGRELPNIDAAETSFVGYLNLEHPATVKAVIKNGAATDSAANNEKALLVLDASPFYGEMGGQAGDTGCIVCGDSVFNVTATSRSKGNVILHEGYVAEGSFNSGDSVSAKVDVARRNDIARNHTATHLLQYALRKVLGEHVQQRGSLVTEERLRFDFSHLKAMTPQELKDIEVAINEKILANLPVVAREMSHRDAVKAGATALFDEKYGDKVRVISIGEPAVSMELCGGTHVSATGDIGMVHIVSESSVGAGLRRIEAVSGRGAWQYLYGQSAGMAELGHILKVPAEKVAEKVNGLLEELESERRHVAALEAKLSKNAASSLIDAVETINGVKVLAAIISDQTMERLREVNDDLSSKLGSAIVVLGSVTDGKPVFLVSVSEDLVALGHDAGKIIREVARVAGGGGGGRPRLAQAGGKDASKVEEAVNLVKKLVSGTA